MRKTLTILLILFPVLVFGYTPPKGIPDPADSFSTFGEIDQATPVWPAQWSGEKSEVENKYYIDKTEAGCSDARTYGYPGYARCLPPEGTLAAGSYVYIHAGTYTAGDSAGQYLDWGGSGTASNPIWITGNASTKPVIQDVIAIGYEKKASYIVVENLAISGSYNFLLRPHIDGTPTGNNSIDHIIIRNITFTGTGTNTDTDAFSIGMSQSTEEAPNETISYVVFYNNTVSNIARLAADETEDHCAVYIGEHTSNTWILNNTIHTIQEDAIAGFHYSSATRQAENIFVGGNTIYNFGANAIDNKSWQNFVISENIISGSHVKSADGPQAAIAIHNAAITGSTPSRNGWIIFNHIYTVGTGIGLVTANNPNENMHVIGNVISDVKTSYSPYGEDAYTGVGVLFAACTLNCWAVDNTIYDTEQPVKVTSSLANETDSLKLHGNIISNINADGYDINITTNGAEAKVDLDYNLFYHPIGGAAAKIFWANASHSLTEIKAHSECANCLESDPKFVSATNYTLQSGSPAIGANVEGPVGATAYDAFATAWSAFSLTIEKDYAGNSRPQGGTWDIGAMEYNPADARPSVAIGAGGANMGIGSGAAMTIY